MSHTSAVDALNALLTATNTHDFDNVDGLLSDDVVYYFSDATVVGRDHVRDYFERTWEAIRDEQYWAEDIQWLVLTDSAAVAVYRFHWRGVIEGQVASGSGRATNAFVRDADGRWLLAHEHLSVSSRAP